MKNKKDDKKTLDDYVDQNKNNEIVKNNQKSPILSSEENALNINEYEKAREKMGIISKTKLTHEQNKTLLRAAKKEYKERLKVYSKKVEAEGIVANKRIDTTLKEVLNRIDKEHINHLSELGVGNFEERNRLLIKLARITTEIFNEINESKIADVIKKDLVKRLMEDRLKLTDEISNTN